MRETWVWSLVWEDPLEEEMATQSSILSWKIPWIVVHQAPLSMWFPRQDSGVDCLFPSPEDLPKPGIKPRSPALQVDSLPAELLDCVDHNKLWKIFKEMRIPDHLTYLVRNLYASQKATVRTRHGTMLWFQIGKGFCQGCTLSPCLFNFYAEYIMRNAGLDEA